eukprot:SAG31_NODE_2877_length_4965_cov_15.095767_1_plen_565_part_10
MHLFAETEGDLKNCSELTHTSEAEGMPLATWFVIIYARPFVGFVLGLHVTRALPLCVDPGSSFQSSIQCLSSDHDSNCDLDADGTHHLSNDSLSPSQQDRSDLMKAPEFDPRSAHESDVSVSNMSARLSCGLGSAYESDLSSSTVHCSGFDPVFSYGPDIFYSTEAVCLLFNKGPAYAPASPFLTKTRCLLFDHGTTHGPRIPFSTKVPFDFGSAYKSDFSVSNTFVRLSFGSGSVHESDLSSSTVHCSGSKLRTSYGSDIPFLAEIAVDAEYAHRFGPPTWNTLRLAAETTRGQGIPRSTDIVCLSYDTRFALESDLSLSKEILYETIYGSQNSSWTNIVCLSSEPKTAYEPEVLFLDKVSCLSCGLQSASECGIPDSSGHLGTARTSFDCEKANEPDVLHWTQTPNQTESAYDDVLDSAHTVRLPSELGPAYAPDVPCSTQIPSEATYGFENLSSTGIVCLSSELEAPYESDIIDSIDSACPSREPGSAYASVIPSLTKTRGLQFNFDSVHEPASPFSARTPFGFGFANDSDILDLTNTVCLPSELGLAYASDDVCSPHIPSE